MSPHSEQLAESALDSLVESIRSVLRPDLSTKDTAGRVAQRLAGYLSEGHPLPRQYRQGSPDHYTQHVMHAERGGNFSVVALVWLPGQSTPIHDHVSWCVTGVYEGEEHEQRYELRGSGERSHLVPTAQTTSGPGEVCALTPPGDNHLVRNSSESVTISLHIYGADISALGTSVRRTYEQPVRTAPRRT